MKIAFFKPHKLARDYIKEWEEDNNIKVDIFDQDIDDQNIEKLADYGGLAMSVHVKLNDNMYSKLSDLGIKQISITSVGFEKLDLYKASENNLIVTNVPNYSPESIAEFTIMMILKALKRDKNINKNLQIKDYRQNENILAETFKGKSLGIYGLGRIGQHVAKLSNAFGAEVLTYSPRGKKDVDGVKFLNSYDELFEKSDIITIHSALTNENYHVFNKETFNKMKDGSILINCARGGLVDTKDLIDAIDSGKISFAGLDVYENEKEINGKVNPNYDDEIFDKLINDDRVDYYPHISYFTKTSLENQVKRALDSVVEVIETGDSKNRVN